MDLKLFLWLLFLFPVTVIQEPYISNDGTEI